MELFALLRERFPGIAAEREFSFARHTTIGCGGRAALCVFPADEEELCAVLGFFRGAQIAYCFLGAGANVLPADGDFEGAVIRFSRMDRLFAEGNTLIAGAGVTGGTLLRAAAACNLGGLHFLTGIPMTAGGAAVMNAGVRGRHISDVLVWAEGEEGGKIRRFSPEECRFSEKSSIFQRGIAVTKVCLRGIPSSQKEIAAERALYRERRAHLPKGRSMGCVFVNPPGLSAGALIERCGLKGARIGGAYVSERHANFILSEGAGSCDVARLIAFVKEEVERKTGIVLREEIRRIP